MTPLKEAVKMILNDINVICEEWNYGPDFDCKIYYPDRTSSTFSKEAKVLAMDSMCKFFQTLLENKRIDCGPTMTQYFKDLTLMIARLYYMT
jgi:hypothetical protein